MSAANKPDVFPGLLLQLLYKPCGVRMDELYERCIGMTGRAAENVVCFVGVGEWHIGAKNHLVGAVAHEGSIEGLQELTVAEVFALHGINLVVQPLSTAVGAGNIAV